MSVQDPNQPANKTKEQLAAEAAAKQAASAGTGVVNAEQANPIPPQEVEIVEDTPEAYTKRREEEQAKLAANEAQAGAETTTNSPTTTTTVSKTTKVNK